MLSIHHDPYLDMDLLRPLVLGIETGSFLKAAGRVGRSRLAVSTQLRRLEDRVGARPGVKQGRRRLVATQAGGEPLHHGRRTYGRRVPALDGEVVESACRSSTAWAIMLGLPRDITILLFGLVLARASVTPPIKDAFGCAPAAGHDCVAEARRRWARP